MARTFAKDAILKWNGNRLTDHNRSELSVDVQRIETATRMANGTMRKYVIADKRTFGVSWSMLPNSADHTVDGFWGADEIENFYNTVPGAFTLTVTHGSKDPETFTVMITNFGKSINKRGKYDMLEVSVEMEEV